MGRHGLDRGFGGLMDRKLGAPPEGSVRWGDDKHRRDAWREPIDNAGHEIPKPPFPRDSKGDFLPIDPNNLTKALELVRIYHRNGMTIPDIAKARGVNERTVRRWIDTLIANLEREHVDFMAEVDRGYAGTVGELRRMKRRGRPPKNRTNSGNSEGSVPERCPHRRPVPVVQGGGGPPSWT
jgi:hypothetical protein